MGYDYFEDKQVYGVHTDSNDTKTHSICVLDSKMTESSTGTGEGDPIANFGTAVFDCTVYGNTLHHGQC